MLLELRMIFTCLLPIPASTCAYSAAGAALFRTVECPDRLFSELSILGFFGKYHKRAKEKEPWYFCYENLLSINTCNSFMRKVAKND